MTVGEHEHQASYGHGMSSGPNAEGTYAIEHGMCACGLAIHRPCAFGVAPAANDAPWTAEQEPLLPSALTWTKTYAGRYHAFGEAHGYTVQRIGLKWQLRIDGDGGARIVGVDWHDSRTLAYGVAEAFETLDESTLFAQPSRFTRAVMQAYAE